MNKKSDTLIINLLILLSVVLGCKNPTTSGQNNDGQPCNKKEISRGLFLTIIESKELEQLIEADKKESVVVLRSTYFPEIRSDNKKFNIIDSTRFSDLIAVGETNLLKFREVKISDTSAYVEYEYVDEGVIGFYDLVLRECKWQIVDVDLAEE